MRRFLLHLVIISGAFTIFSKVTAQTVEDSLLHNIQLYDSLGEFSLYYENVNKLQNEYVRKGNYTLMLELEEYYLQKPFSKEDSTVYRNSLKFHAFYIKKYTNNLRLSNEFYLRAHHNVRDKTMLDENAWYIEKHLASNYAKLNQYENSIYYSLKMVSGLVHRGQYEKLSRLYADIGYSYKWINNVRTAIVYYQKGLEIAKKYDSEKGYLANSTRILEAYSLTNDSIMFKQFYTEVLWTLDQSELKDRYERINQLNEIKGDYEHSQSRYDNAIEIYHRILSSKQKITQREKAKIFLKLARNYFEKGDYTESQSYITKSFAMLGVHKLGDFDSFAKQLYAENVFVDLLSLKCDYYYHMYLNSHEPEFLDSLLKSSSIALYINDLLHVELMTDESKLVSIGTVRGILEKQLLAMYKQYENGDPSYSFDKVKNVFDRSKNTLLKEKKLKLKSLEKLDQKNKEKYYTLEKELRRLNSVLSKGIENANVNLKFHEVYTEMDQLLATRNTEAVREIITPYVEYISSKKGLYFISNIEGYEFNFVGKNEFSIKELFDVLEMIKSKSSLKLLRNKLENISSKILPPTCFNKGELVIIPDGYLCLFPFEVLILHDQYLLENTAISYSYNRYNNRPYDESKETYSLYIVAPSYGVATSTEIKKDAVTRSDIYHLKYSNSEVDAIQEELPNTLVYQGTSIDTILSQSKMADIFHFAGHAKSSDRVSSLVLSDENNEMSLEDISFWSNSFDLVTLSACETGLGELKNGEGVKSLANSFLENGTNNILFSLWAVNDLSTSKLMGKFYKNINVCKSYSLALQKAKLSYLANSSPTYRHPYYWAGFVLNEKQYLKQEQSYLKWGLSFLSIIILLILLKIIL